MPDQKISQLPLKTTPVVADETVIVDISDGLNKKVKLENLPVSNSLTNNLNMKLNKAGDTGFGTYGFTHDDFEPNYAVSTRNLEPNFLSGFAFQNDVDGCGFGLANSNFTAMSPILNPGDTFINGSNLDSSTVIYANKVAGFRIAQNNTTVASVIDGTFSGPDINASAPYLNGLPTKATPVSGDEVLIRDVTNNDCKKLNLQSIPITTQESNRLVGFSDSLYVRYTPTVATNSTTNVLIDSVFIPAGTFSSDDVINIKTLFLEKIGVTGTATFTFFINSSNSLTGATQVHTTSTLATNQYNVYSRKFHLSGGLIYALTTNLFSDVTSVTGAWTTATYNVGTSYWLLLAIRVANAADSIRSLAVQWEKR